MKTIPKKLIPIKVANIVAHEFDSIQIQEGFGNRAATFTFLIKFYQLKKQSEFERAADNLGNTISQIDPKIIPSIEEQLDL